MARDKRIARAAMTLMLVVANSATFPALAETLEDFQHTPYTAFSNAPSNVASIAQDDEGFLWMVGPQGLTRFDGVSFQPYATLPNEVFRNSSANYTIAAEGGGVWMDGDTRGPMLAQGGHVKTYGAEQGYTGKGMWFYRGPTGHVRSMSDRGINEFSDGRWKLVQSLQRGLMVSVDEEHREWIIAEEKLWLRTSQEVPPALVDGAPNDPWGIRTGPGGRIYLPERNAIRIFRFDGSKLREVAEPTPSFGSGGIIATRSDGLWRTQLGGVMFASDDALAEAEKLHAAPRFESFTKENGLTGNVITRIYEDRDRTIWVATSGGVDAFRRSAFREVKVPNEPPHVSAAVNSKGTLWVGSGNTPVLRRTSRTEWKEIGEKQTTFALVRDAENDVAWAMNQKGLWRLAEDADTRAAPFPYPEWDGESDCLATDSAGNVYTCPLGRYGNQNLIPKVWNGQRWSNLPEVPGRATTAVFDAQGVLWYALSKSRDVVRLVRDKFASLGPQDGLTVGPVSAMTPDGNGIWFGGDGGVQFFDGKHFAALVSEDPWFLEKVTGIVVDDAGVLWIHTRDGVFRSRESRIASSMAVSKRAVAFDHFGPSDGIRNTVVDDRTMPSLRMGGDGRLWVQTASGLLSIDPKFKPPARQPNPPRVDSVEVAGKPGSPVTGAVRLSPDERDLRVSYSAPALTHADSLRFAYRLVGLEDQWTDAGARREATFTNLPPGLFQFEVKAVDQAGPSSSVTALAIHRDPAFHETKIFEALLVLPFLALGWLVYALRLRSISHRMRIRMDEREAVARDIHDTLLQRIQGVMLTMEAWSTDREIPEDKRREMLGLSEQTREALIEGRERIAALRSPQDRSLTLYDALSREGQRLAAAHQQAFSIQVAGASKPLREEAEAELRAVAIEAIRNAFRHSQGTSVSVVISWEADALWLVISDDGKGLDEHALSSALSDRHFGLVGLKERVARLKGSVTIDSARDEGTEVHVRIPANMAYGR